MKKLILSIYAMLLVVSSFAQTVPNGGFENWYNNYYFDEPNFVTTSKLQSYFSILKKKMAMLWPSSVQKRQFQKNFYRFQ